MHDLKERAVAYITAPNYRPVKPRVIARKLGLDREATQGFSKAIRFLAQEGRIRQGPNHVVFPAPNRAEKKERRAAKEDARRAGDLSPPVVAAESEQENTGGLTSPARQRTPSARRSDRDKNVIVGIFRRIASGAGFVRPRDTPRSAGREQDIMIPRPKTRDAADGDKVAVRLMRGDREGRSSGEIVEILERDTHRFVGVYEEQGASGYVKVDGKVFAEPIYVGDASAKAARPGDKVVVEMVRFPSHSHDGEGVIVEVLGARGQPGVDTLSIIREFDLPGEFPEHVLEDARHQADKFDESVADRTDFTGDTVITIDPVDARDFDDAISLRRLENGHWLLGVHIADVSHFVPLRSKLDTEARDRATSVYLPDRVIPMLPEIISNHLASLQPDKVRYTQTCLIEFTPEGVPVHAEVKRGAIRSKRRFAYEEVDDFLGNRKAWRTKLEPDVWQLLSDMHSLAMTLRKRRLDRGAIELTLPEIKIDLDDQGKVAGAHLTENTESHQMIEEFMLAANEAVARILSAAGFHLLRRIHEQPDLRKLQTLTTFVKELGIECDSLESRFEIKRVVAAVAGTPREHAVNYAVLRSMQKAVYSPAEEGHYALNSENYCHFTSPIRRYPDLTVHRMLNALTAGKKAASDFAEQMLLGEHCSEREQRAEKAERELKKVKLLSYLATRVGETMDGVITGVEEFGFFVQGTQLPAEGLIHIRSLGDDYYHFDRRSHSLVGRRANNSYQLGDLVQVEIMHVDADRRELDFRLVKKLAAGPEPKLPRKSRRGEKEAAKVQGARRKKKQRPGKRERSARRNSR
jgi:ribonuclease R